MADTQGYPSSIDARARFREQQHYPPRTAGPAPDRPTAPTRLSAYPSHASHSSAQRPTTAPAMPSLHATSNRSAPTTSLHYQHGFAEHMSAYDSRPTSSSGESMPPPRGFGPPSASRYHPPDAYEIYQPYTRHQKEPPSHAYAPPDPYLPRVQAPGSRSRPTSSSGGQRITLPSLSEMIRRPDLDPPSIPASTSSLRTLLNPEARTLAVQRPLPGRESDMNGQGFSSHAREPSPHAEEHEHPSEEDRRYYEIRARHTLHRRPSATDSL